MASHTCQVHRVTPLDLLVMGIAVIILYHGPLHHVLDIGLVTIHLVQRSNNEVMVNREQS